MAVGFDIEWEVGSDGPPQGTVHGDVLVGRARHEIDGPGWFYGDGDADPAAVEGEVVETIYIPVDNGYRERNLVRIDDGLHWS
jgi:hypothetical protein